MLTALIQTVTDSCILYRFVKIIYTDKRISFHFWNEMILFILHLFTLFTIVVVLRGGVPVYILLFGL